MSDDDWSKDPDMQEWIASVRSDLVPKMQDSDYVMSLVPDDNQFDAKFAVELGTAIMLDKPLCFVVTPGSKMPEHLVRVADEIIEHDWKHDSKESLTAKIAAFAERFEQENGSDG